MDESQLKTPAALGFRMPAEWHTHHSTWLTWPKDPETWPDRVSQVEEIYLQMIAALTPHEIVNLLVDDEETEAAIRERISAPIAVGYTRISAPRIAVRRAPSGNHWSQQTRVPTFAAPVSNA